MQQGHARDRNPGKRLADLLSWSASLAGVAAFVLLVLNVGYGWSEGAVVRKLFKTFLFVVGIFTMYRLGHRSWTKGTLRTWRFIALVFAALLVGIVGLSIFSSAPQLETRRSVSQPRVGQVVDLKAWLVGGWPGINRLGFRQLMGEGDLEELGTGTAQYVPDSAGTHVIEIYVWNIPWLERSSKNLTLEVRHGT